MSSTRPIALVRARHPLVLGSAVAVILATAVAAATGPITVAGTGTPGFSGDGAPATAAQLDRPHAVARDRDGGFLIVDFANERIRRVHADGSIATVAGNGTAGFAGDGGPAKQAELHAPHDVTSTDDGGLLIADTANHRIRRVSREGTITTLAGSGPTGAQAGGFSGDSGPASEARLNNPQGVVALRNGAVLIADTDNHRIRRVSREGRIETIAGGGPIGTNRGSDGGNGAIATEARLNHPKDVAEAHDGSILIADAGNNQIRGITRGGRMARLAGSGPGYSGDGDPAVEAQLSDPHAVVPTADGGVMIADAGNDRIRRISPTGRITTVAGGSSAAPLTLARPEGVALFNDGFLIADEGNHRVLLVPMPLDLRLLTRTLKVARGAQVRLRYLLAVRATVRITLRRNGRTAARLRRRADPGRNFVTLPRFLALGRYAVTIRAKAPDGQVATARSMLTIVN